MHAEVRLLEAIYEGHRDAALTACDAAFIEKVYDFLLGTRELDIDTFRSTIEIQADYTFYITKLAEALDANEADVLRAMDTLIAKQRLIVYPNPEDAPYFGWIDCIEVKDRPSYPLLELIEGKNPMEPYTYEAIDFKVSVREGTYYYLQPVAPAFSVSDTGIDWASLVVHRSPGEFRKDRWFISERSTGSSIEIEATTSRDDAVKRAVDKIRQTGREHYEEALARTQAQFQTFWKSGALEGGLEGGTDGSRGLEGGTDGSGELEGGLEGGTALEGGKDGSREG